MTRNEFIEKYGEVEVTFSSYYKFSFHFKGEAENGDVIKVSVGGNSDDIYKFDVTADNPVTIASLDPYMGMVFGTNGEEYDCFNDY